MTDPRSEARAVAEKIMEIIKRPADDAAFGGLTNPQIIESLLVEFAEEIHKEIAIKQATIYGESVILGGKLITNEELYKQPTDYIHQAVAEQIEKDAKIALKFDGITVRPVYDWYAVKTGIAAAIIAQRPGEPK